MTSEAKSAGMPVWAKVLIVLFTVGLIGTITLVAMGAAWVADFQRQASNPARAFEVALSIAKFQQPMPADFEFTNGYPFPAFPVALAIYKPDKTLFTVTKMPNAGDRTAAQIGNDIASRGGQHNAKMEITGKGTEAVAGEQMAYLVGQGQAGSEKFEQMIGVVVPKADKSSAIMIVGVTPGGKYNMAATQEFLKTIKGF